MSELELYKTETTAIFHYLMPRLRDPRIKKAFLESAILHGHISVAEVLEASKNAEAMRKRLKQLEIEKNLQNEAERQKRMGLAANFPRWFRKSKAGDPTAEFLQQFSPEELKEYIQKVKSKPKLYNEMFNYNYNEAVYLLERELQKRTNKKAMVI